MAPPQGSRAIKLAAAILGMTALGGALSACSSNVTTDATDAAARFESALSSNNMNSACALLAPRTVKELEDSSKQECAKALRAAELPAGGSVRGAEVAGHAAQVVLAHDTLFLALFDDGWRVSAAGCTRDDPDDRVPYDCTVKG